MPRASGKPGGRSREKPSVSQKAVDLLSRSVHSKRELRRKLIQREYAPEEADAGIRRLEELNLLNESRDAAAAARSLYSRGYWGIAVRSRLAQRGFSRQAVDQAVEMLEADETPERLIRRLLPSKPPADEKSARRVALRLIRRGLPVRKVRESLRDLSAEAFEEIEREAETLPDGEGNEG